MSPTCPTQNRVKVALAEIFGEPDNRGVTVRELAVGPVGAPDIRLSSYLPHRRAGAAGILDARLSTLRYGVGRQGLSYAQRLVQAGRHRRAASVSRHVLRQHER